MEYSHDAGNHSFNVEVDGDVIIVTIESRSPNVGLDTIDHMGAIAQIMQERQMLAVFLIIDASAVKYIFADAIALTKIHRAAQEQGGATDVRIIPMMVHTDAQSRKILHIFKDSLHHTNTRGHTETAMPIFVMNSMEDAWDYVNGLKRAHADKAE